MKRLILPLLIISYMLCLIGCTHLYKEQPLHNLMPVQKMIQNIALGNLEDAWNPVYSRKADPEPGNNLELYAEIFAGREVMRCDCYDHERTGDPTVFGE